MHEWPIGNKNTNKQHFNQKESESVLIAECGKCRRCTLSKLPIFVHKNSCYYSYFSKIKPGVPAISETPKCQEVLQDYMKNKNMIFFFFFLAQLEGIRHCLSPPLFPLNRASKYQKVKSIHPSLRKN